MADVRAEGDPAIKAGVVGCGGAATWIHIPWYAAHPEVEVVGPGRHRYFPGAVLCEEMG